MGDALALGRVRGEIGQMGRTLTSAGALVAAAALACGPPAPNETPELPGIIDVHIHAAFPGTPDPASGIVRSRQRLRADMERAGVTGAVAMEDSTGAGGEDLGELGVIRCAGIGSTVDSARIARGLAEGRYRCLKIYLGYAARFPTDPAYEVAYRLARTHDVPVVFHTGDTSSPRGRLRFAHPLPVDEVAVAHPEVTFVIAHAGYPWYQTAAEVAYKNPNVYLEASAFMVGNPATAAEDWVETYVVEPIRWIFGYVEDPTKLLFGSDWPLVDMAGYVAAYRRAIPPEHWRAVFHDNAVRVFRLER